jgi:toxin CcdB
MARFDIYENSNRLTRAEVPYLLDVQADLLDNLATRVVVPLVKLSAMGKPAKHLNPQFTINKEKLVMSTAELAGIPVSALGEKSGTLKERQDEIIAALDFLLSGF